MDTVVLVPLLVVLHLALGLLWRHVELSRRRLRVERVGQAMAQAEDPRTGLTQAAIAVSGADVAILWEQHDHEPDRLVAHTVSGDGAPSRHIEVRRERSLVATSFLTAQRLFSPDVSSDPRVSQRLGEEVEARSMVAQPVVAEGRVVGVLAVLWKRPRRHVDAEVIAWLQLMAGTAANAIERARLLALADQAARTDALTGVANRRVWDEQLPLELERVARGTAEPPSIALLDLDHFKSFNDEYGHQAGDKLLQQAAGRWMEALRANDVLARWGGEEFAVLMPSTDLEEAVSVVDRLRPLVPAGRTVSAGVATWDRSESIAELVARADRALYAAKGAGRDKVVADAAEGQLPGGEVRPLRPRRQRQPAS